jgi:hypothetical protein
VNNWIYLGLLQLGRGREGEERCWPSGAPRGERQGELTNQVLELFPLGVEVNNWIYLGLLQLGRGREVDLLGGKRGLVISNVLSRSSANSPERERQGKEFTLISVFTVRTAQCAV